MPNQEAKEQLSPLSAALEKLQQEKQELVDRKRQRQEEGQEKVVDPISLLSLFHVTKKSAQIQKQLLLLSCTSNFLMMIEVRCLECILNAFLQTHIKKQL